MYCTDVLCRSIGGGDATDQMSAAAAAATASTDKKAESSFTPTKFATPFFCTGKYESHAKFIPDELYGQVLDSITKATNDIIVLEPSGKRLLLGKRNVYPQKDWWFGCGGRINVNESIADSTKRLMKRELSINLHSGNGERVETVGHYSFVWRMRQQPPKDHGTCDISVISTVTLSAEELATLKIDANEYEAREWVCPIEILKTESGAGGVAEWAVPVCKELGFGASAATATATTSQAADEKKNSTTTGSGGAPAVSIASEYHPALIRGLLDWLKILLFKRLEQRVSDPTADDAAIAKLSKQYVSFVRSVSQFRGASDHSKRQIDNFL